MDRKRRSKLVLAAAALLAVTLTGCGAHGRPVDPSLTLEDARGDLRAAIDEVLHSIPDEAISSPEDDWTTKTVTLLPCEGSDNAYIYSRSIWMLATDAGKVQDAIRNLYDRFQRDEKWTTTWGNSDSPPSAVNLTQKESNMFVSINLTRGRVRITGFSECFAGDEYNLLDKY